MFRVVLHSDAARELERIAMFHRRAILQAMRLTLTREPTAERRSRVKRMRGDFYPPFRLRVGEFRVYDDVDEERSEVIVLHVWEKGRRSTPPDLRAATRRKR